MQCKHTLVEISKGQTSTSSSITFSTSTVIDPVFQCTECKKIFTLGRYGGGGLNETMKELRIVELKND